MNTRTTPWLTAVLPVVADGVALLLAVLSLPALVRQLETPGGWNALLLTAVYLLFCLSVYLIRKLQPLPLSTMPWRPPAALLTRRVLGALGALFGLAMTTALALQLGFFQVWEEIRLLEFGEGETAVFFAFAPGAWLGVSMIYILILAFSVEATVSPYEGRYPWLTLAGLLGMNGMLLLAAAQFGALWMGSGLATAVRLLLTFGGLLLLLGPPRLLFWRRQPRRNSVFSFLLIVAICAVLAT
jgi:hypothetical protein